MLSGKLGHFLDAPLSPLVKRIPLSPNFFTSVGFLITVVAALLIAITQNIRLGGIAILLAGLFDMADGIVARVGGKVTRFGAFLDSVLDRYSDAALFIAISWYLMEKGSLIGTYLSLGTLVGAFLISYTRARAEGLGESCYIGIMERPERIVLLIFATITGWLIPVLWLMLILTHITALQRIYHVYRAMR